MVFGLVVLASSPPLYGKAPRLILKKANRLAQELVFSRRYFLQIDAARCCDFFRQQSVKVCPEYTCTMGMFSNTWYWYRLCAASCVTKDLPFSPQFLPTIFYRDTNSVLLLVRAHVRTLCAGRTLRSKMFSSRA